jgi:phosphatidate cytidylyltransferase
MHNPGFVDPRRVYSALVFFPCFYILVRYLPPIAFFVFVLAGIVLAQYEYYRLYFSEKWTPNIGLGLVLGVLVASAFAVDTPVSGELIVSLIVVTALLIQVGTGREIKSGLLDSAVVVFGVFYIAWLLSHMILLRGLEQGPYLIFFLFLVTWANDTGAYYTGKLIGKHQMSPKISPSKTWEGTAGGLMASVAAAFICRGWFLPSLPVSDALGLGLLFGVMAPLGDLCESVLKRSAGVKDSGRLIPGHGGILDRIDSLIFTTPTFYYWLLAIRTP